MPKLMVPKVACCENVKINGHLYFRLYSSLFSHHTFHVYVNVHGCCMYLPSHTFVGQLECITCSDTTWLQSNYTFVFVYPCGHQSIAMVSTIALHCTTFVT